MTIDSWRRQLMLDHVDRAKARHADSLEATVLRSRSLAGRELLAFDATGGRLTTAEVIEACRTDSLTPLERPEPMFRLARVLAKSQILEHDLPDAVAVYSWLDRHHADAFDRDHTAIYLQALFAVGRVADVGKGLERLDLPPRRRRQLQVDLMNPTVSETEWGLWLYHFSDLMGVLGAGFGPVALSDGSGAPFDRLHAPVGRRRSGPLVTVATTTYRPGVELLTAMRSLVRQTWRNLELLVVDDGSGPEYTHVFSEVERLDDRIHVIRLPANGGTYRARNVALELARGEFFTVHDSDDWAHPHRIEESVVPLLQHGGLVATKGSGIRVDDNLVMNIVGRAPVIPAATSLTFRKRPVIARMGYYDEARKGADTEYERRMSLVFGESAVMSDGPTLTVVRRRKDGGSLSNEEFRPGWKHPSRFAYRSAYGRWHHAIADGASPVLAHSAGPRPFSIPLAFSPSRKNIARYDVVYLSHWTVLGAPQFSMLAEIDALRTEGRSVAICHMESYRFMTRRDLPIHPAVQRRVDLGHFDHVVLDDPVEADLVIVRYPPVLQFPPADPKSRWRVGNVWIVANQAPCERDGSDRRYVVDDCEAHARLLFGCDPLWVPQGPVVRQSLREEMPSDRRLASFDDPSILVADEWASEHRPWEHTRVRLGRYSRDHPMKFPAGAAELMAAYPCDPDLQIRMMGATKVVAALLGAMERPSNWEVLPYGAMHVRDFLRTIDFFVYYDHPAGNEAFGRSILEAMAAGVVVILEPRYQEVFGDAALYCPPAEAANLARRLHADPDAYRRQVERAREVIEAEFSPAAFLRRVIPFLDIDQPACTVAAHSRDVSFLVTERSARNQVDDTWSGLDLESLSVRVSRGAADHHMRLNHRPLGPPISVVVVGAAPRAPIAEQLARVFAVDGVGGLERELHRGDASVAAVVVQDGRNIHVLPARHAPGMVWSYSTHGFAVGSADALSSADLIGGEPRAGDQGRRQFSLSGGHRGSRTLPADHRLRVDTVSRVVYQEPVAAYRA